MQIVTLLRKKAASSKDDRIPPALPGYAGSYGHVPGTHLDRHLQKSPLIDGLLYTTHKEWHTAMYLDKHITSTRTIKVTYHCHNKAQRCQWDLLTCHSVRSLMGRKLGFEMSGKRHTPTGEKLILNDFD